MVQVARILRGSGDYNVTLYASDAALGALAEYDEPFVAMSPAPPYAAEISENELAQLRTTVNAIFEREKPNALICGLSNYPNGIDDAAMATAHTSERSCPSVLLLDDKGPISTLDNRHPDHVLAVNGDIADWAQGNTTAKVHRIGSPKHDAMSRQPVDAIRANYRSNLGFGDDVRLVVFIAQSSDIPGHDRNFELFLNSLARCKSENTVVFLRAHPSFPDTAERYTSSARALGVDIRRHEESNIIPLLCASDALLTCTSTVMQDYAWLARGGRTLNAFLAHMLIGDDMRTWLEATFGDWRPAMVTAGVAEALIDPDQLENRLQDWFGTTSTQQRRATIVPEIDDPAAAVLTAMCDVLGRDEAAA